MSMKINESLFNKKMSMKINKSLFKILIGLINIIFF